MSDTVHLLASVKLGEGFRANPYTDTRGLWTVGYGTCLEEQPLTAAQWRQLLSRGDLAVSLSQAGADYLLSSALEASERACALTWKWWPELGDARQNVLIEMAYNMGLSKVLMFRQMLEAIAEQDWEEAAAQMLDSTWARQVGERAHRLAAQMRAGAFS